MVNKLLFIGVLLAGAGGVGMWWMSAQKPQGELIPVGFGEASSDGIPLELAVSMFMPKREGPKLRGVIQWEEWIDSHFVCRGPSGDPIKFHRANFSKSIPESVSGTPEFFIIGIVKPGVKYTFEYAPVLAEPQRLQWEFTAPAAKQPGERVMF